MIIENDNSKIYQFLEKANKLPKNFELDYVNDFEQDNNFYIFIYESVTRNFLLFVAEDYFKHPDELEKLLNAIATYSDDDKDELLMEMAIKIVENKIRSNNTGHFLFDAH